MDTAPPNKKDHQGGDSDAITSQSLYSSSSLGHTTISNAVEQEGAAQSSVSGKHL